MLKFYHAPWSRSSAVHWLLEELSVDYELVHVDIRQEGGVSEDYRAVQPNKKVPAIEHAGVVVTERAAISIYLCDTFPEAGLAPAIGDPLRGPYLSWLAYCDAVLDPCITARARRVQYTSGNDFSFGLFEDLVRNVETRLSENEYIAGDRFTAADVQLGASIEFTMNTLKVLPKRPAFRDYVARLEERPAYQRYRQKDDELAMTVPVFRQRFAQAGNG